MKKYLIPETTCLSINAQTMICASVTPAPGRGASVQSMSNGGTITFN